MKYLLLLVVVGCESTPVAESWRLEEPTLVSAEGPSTDPDPSPHEQQFQGLTTPTVFLQADASRVGVAADGTAFVETPRDAGGGKFSLYLDMPEDKPDGAKAVFNHVTGGDGTGAPGRVFYLTFSPSVMGAPATFECPTSTNGGFHEWRIDDALVSCANHRSSVLFQTFNTGVPDREAETYIEISTPSGDSHRWPMRVFSPKEHLWEMFVDRRSL